MRIAIIGAGMAGLGAARALVQHEHSVTLFDKNTVPGGRVASESQEGFVFDTGAQNFATAGSSLDAVIHSELDTADLIRIEKPIFTHDGHHTQPGNSRVNSNPRYTYRTGNQTLPLLLAKGLDIQFGSNVDQLSKAGNSVVINEQLYDGLILTAPVPQSSFLLWSLGEKRPTAQAKFRSCLSVQLGYDFELDLPFHAAIDPDGTTPLQWIGIESIKSPNRAPIGNSAVVAQLGGSFSQSAWLWTDSQIIQQSTGQLATLFGQKMLRPVFSNVKKWKYSQPEEIAMFDTVNNHQRQIIVAGDGLMGGRTELAFESGLRAAYQIMEGLK